VEIFNILECMQVYYFIYSLCVNEIIYVDKVILSFKHYVDNINSNFTSLSSTYFKNLYLS